MRTRRFLCVFLALALLVTVTGCGAGSSAAAPSGSSLQTPAEETASAEKTVVTMMYNSSLANFEQLVEQTYDDIDLQVEMSTIATINGDSERRLKNGHGTDLIVTTLPSGDVQGYTLDLSTEEFASSYQSTVMNSLLVDGQIRFLPLPGQYTGYIINTTLTQELGNDLPQTNQDLFDLLNDAAQQGIGVGEDGIVFGLESADIYAIGRYFISQQIPDFLSQMEGIQWLAAFRSGSQGFSGVWDSCLDWFQVWVDSGYFNPKAYTLTITNSMPVEQRMLDGTMILCYGNMKLLNTLDQSEDYEYTMLPFLSSEGNSSWATSSPDGYIAINTALAEPGNEDTLDAARRVLALLSTVEGQMAWLSDTSATMSYLSVFQNQDIALPDTLQACVDALCVYNLQIPSDVVFAFGQAMLSVLMDDESMTEALASVDDYVQNGDQETDYDQTLVGTVTEDLLYENYNTRLEETAIGNLVADAVAEWAGTDLAVVNGGGIRASLYAGDVYGSDLAAVCPYSNYILAVEATGQVIWDMLENGISQTLRDNLIPGGRFLQVSGLCYTYQPMTETEPAQLLAVTLADGTPLEMDKTYTLAINDYMAGYSGYLENNGDGFTMLNLLSQDVPAAEGVTLLAYTAGTYADALKAYFQNHSDSPITAQCQGRITAATGE